MAAPAARARREARSFRSAKRQKSAAERPRYGRSGSTAPAYCTSAGWIATSTAVRSASAGGRQARAMRHAAKIASQAESSGTTRSHPQCGSTIHAGTASSAGKAGMTFVTGRSIQSRNAKRPCLKDWAKAICTKSSTKTPSGRPKAENPCRATSADTKAAQRYSGIGLFCRFNRTDYTSFEMTRRLTRLALAALAFAVFVPSLSGDFVLDDEFYIT